MILYSRKDDRGSGRWYQLKLIGLYDGLMFDEYQYKIEDTVYSEDSEDFQIAYEKEKMWYLLNKTKRTNLEVMRDLGSVVEEIKENQERERKEAMDVYIRRKQASKTKVEKT